MLLELLKAAGGEASLRSALGRWRKAVSSALDQLQDESYSIVRQTPFAASFATPTADVILNEEVVRVGSAVTYDDATGRWTLAASGLYELEFFGQFENFGAVGDTAQIAWTDLANAELVAPTGSSLGTVFFPGTSTINASTKPVSRLLYPTGAAAEQIKLRLTNLTSTGDLSAGSYAIVRKLR